MRHAKSSRDSDAPSDHERPLNERGRRDAPRIAARIVALGWTPEYVLASDSVRTRETFNLMAGSLSEAGAEPMLVFTSQLYDCDTNDVRRLLAELGGEFTTVLVLGHNPCLEETLHWLTGQDTVLTTANAALLTGAGATWAATVSRPRTWAIDDVIRPKEL
jgi:phosphohistidine phosphatase